MATTPDAFLHLRATTVRIDDSCTACGSCLITCPTTALRRAPKRPLVVDDRCIACGDCVEICPVGAIREIDIVRIGAAS